MLDYQDLHSQNFYLPDSDFNLYKGEAKKKDGYL